MADRTALFAALTVGLGISGMAAAGDLIELDKKTTAVVIDSVAGTITLTPAAEGAPPSLGRRDRGDTKMCELHVDKSKGVTTVRFGPKSAAQPEPCASDLELFIPDGVLATVSLHSGDVRVGAIAGPAEIDVRSGDLTVGAASDAIQAVVTVGDARLEGPSGPVALEVRDGELRGTASGRLVLKLGTGIIDLDGLSSVLTAHSARGHIHLVYAEVPDGGTIRAEASQGNVVVDLPGAPTVNCQAASTLGRATCDLPQDDAAATTVHALTGNGSVRVF